MSQSDWSSANTPEFSAASHRVETTEGHATTSNQDGYYSFPVLLPATYSLTVEAPGFTQFVHENIPSMLGRRSK